MAHQLPDRSPKEGSQDGLPSCCRLPSVPTPQTQTLSVWRSSPGRCFGDCGTRIHQQQPGPSTSWHLKFGHELKVLELWSFGTITISSHPNQTESSPETPLPPVYSGPIWPGVHVHLSFKGLNSYPSDIVDMDTRCQRTVGPENLLT